MRNRNIKTRKGSSFTEDEIDLERHAKTLGNPARFGILKQLAATGGCLFNELSAKLPLADSTVSKHMAELLEAGLVYEDHEPPRKRYSINRKNWK